MFAFLVFWAYMEFSQGIIIWIANKPDEVPWYVARGAGAVGRRVRRAGRRPLRDPVLRAAVEAAQAPADAARDRRRVAASRCTTSTSTGS